MDGRPISDIADGAEITYGHSSRSSRRKGKARIQHHFFSHDAVRPDRAVAFEPSRSIERRQFERLRERGVIHEAKPGLYWLDVVAYDVDLRQRFNRVRTVLLIMVLALMVGLLVSLVAR